MQVPERIFGQQGEDTPTCMRILKRPPTSTLHFLTTISAQCCAPHMLPSDPSKGDHQQIVQRKSTKRCEFASVSRICCAKPHVLITTLRSPRTWHMLAKAELSIESKPFMVCVVHQLEWLAWMLGCFSMLELPWIFFSIPQSPLLLFDASSCPSFQKNPRVCKNLVRNSGAGNGCANFMCA